jgi:hypothetical protein
VQGSVREDAEKLSKDDSELFHSLTARLLFLLKRARPQIQTAVAFLRTRTVCPYCDDYQKLGRVVKHLRKYPTLAVTLQADGLHEVRWSVDASFAVHEEMKSHTGGCGTLGKGAFLTMSNKQKLNPRSSTEAELVGVDDMMCKILWTQYFLKGQEYDMAAARVAQDNMSAILLETNGMKSSSNT